MKNIILITILSIYTFVNSTAQTGKVFDNLTMKSTILKSERKFAVYLPPDYETSQRNYPVLYLLHGMGDDQTGWVQFGEVLSIVDNEIKKGTATPMIIIMPDANTNKIGYFNTIESDWNYENFFFEELMPYVEKTYRIKSEKRFRAIAGLSMGGGGSFMYAMHHPELFSSACPLSAYIGPLSVEDFKIQLQRMNSKITDETKIQSYFENHNAISLIEKTDVAKLKSVRWFIDCGDDDFLYEGNSLVHIAMRKKEIPHEYRVRNGGHSWTYWRESLPEVLKFVSDAFHQY
ncbi:alpha/beta hydrolase [Lutibacter maritimus]|uniref:Enterochelin esterase n=1 Tax=Lutibacter maritimus TaxID=593133 RepID=A0A1I6PFY2_9FLAO|nr:alpha/beta hydrolase-fold protein [Lutibacter maritimus]SFS39121.1 Enterochelin esterase [Lutibacter maritimus]